MMIVCKYRYLLKPCKYLMCDRMLSTPLIQGLMLSNARFATVVAKTRRLNKRKTEKAPEKELQKDDESSNSKPKGAINSSEDKTSSEVLTNSVNEKSDSKTEKRQTQNVIDDFLIRNIMSFPLHVPAEEVESEIVDNQPNTSVTYVPSVSAILQETMSEESKKILEIWKQNMIKTLGEEKFYAQQKATLNRGSKFHSVLKQYLEGGLCSTNITVPKEVEGCWNSVQSVLPEISDVRVVECNIHHPHLHYRGIVDCIASYRNVPHVIEWKQSEKPKKTLSDTYDAPIQLCAYMGALSWCKNVDKATPVTNGLVVVAYIDGSPADAFQMDVEFCQTYWQQWLRRVQQYWSTHSPKIKPSAG
ncbi:UNVERIFIED_CONTAM: hypothetical protein PYX00_001915 [Menopon gallinae]|uniref:Mitochondrial genome maintenance exonuclease 1 n=1 Tax=Menopon gallinae TaxID=328185 RepID=A0AAW2IF74_9NEOP